jgi:hypothetical protein
MDDVSRKFPYTQRRNYMHRARLRKAFQELGVTEHIFPHDFFRRHWRDQQVYIEQVLKLQFCARCKIPVQYLDGALCEPCAQSNDRSWRANRAWKEREVDERLTIREAQRRQAERNIPEHILEKFDRNNSEAKAKRFALEYGVSIDDAKDILEPAKPNVSVMDILAKARKQS